MTEIILDGKYKIIKMIGRGGMGSVYVAENIKLNTLWAIKEISRKHHKADYVKEYDILKNLNHPALPRIFDIFEENENIYIVEDYIEGTNLKDYLKHSGTIDERTSINWILQLCSVLKYLHSFKPSPIIYRDMKPSNIMLTKEGELKLVDFGIAREYKEDAQTDTVFIGTRGYAAPEQFGTGQSSFATDIFSLGVTMYHLITGLDPSVPPYKLQPIRDIKPNLSFGMENIITRCTRENPNERYQNIDELIAEVNKLVKKNRYFITQEPFGESFKRLILCVLENTEFAVELACAVAKSTNLKTLIVDTDIYESQLDIYLNSTGKLAHHISEYNESPVETAWSMVGKGIDSRKIIEKTSLKIKKNLHILSGVFNSAKVYGGSVEFGKIIDMSYRSFDLCIVLVNRNNVSEEIIKNADYLISAINANVDKIREYKKHMGIICERYRYPLEQVRYVAYEYKKDINLPISILKKAFSPPCYLGKIDYKPEREKCRNEEVIFADLAAKQLKEEYKGILKHFNIKIKPDYLERLVLFFKKIGKSVRHIKKDRGEKFDW